MGSRRAIYAVGGGVGLVIAGCLALSFSRSRPDFETIVRNGRREFDRGRYAQAEALARRVLARDPQHVRALLLAAEAAVRQTRLDAALDDYQRIPDGDSPESIGAAFGAGEVLIHLGRLSEGEQHLRRALRHDPSHLPSHDRLAFVLGITGRRWESMPHLLEVVRAGQYDVQHLLMLSDAERLLRDERLLNSARRAAPDDPLPRLGLARLAIAANDLPRALSLFKQVVSAIPDELEAQARLGVALLETGAREEFLRWHAGLPPTADDHPEIWVCRGRWALESSQPRSAARCFREAVLRDPDHRLANYRLGQTLNDLSEPAQAAVFLKRAEGLQHLATVMDRLFYDQRNTVSMHKAVLLAEPLGRLWEAWGWARLALSEDATLGWAAATIRRLEPLLAPDLPRTVPDSNPARQFGVAEYPLPNWNSVSVAAGVIHPEFDGRIRFENIAADAGIQFVYFNSPDPATPGARIFETTGGGVAALDYDGDLWPDLYFTQGCQWPPGSGDASHRDRLFRNRGDGRAADVTEAAGLGDERFSQGVAVGDYDNDGFPDLYVANIGPNRLYRNNGDGTFRDVTRAAQVHDDAWTTSCLMADLNGDSWPDLYDVNYCAGESVFSRLCPKEGVSRACSPRTFDAAPDKVFLGRGDGTFEDASESSGIDVPDGYGLGIVAADFEGTGHLNLFVANDETANFYFVNLGGLEGRTLQFAERGLLAGLAFDADGMAQACMGVAAGDADGNGLIDLYVSNFYNESDTLYLQQPAGLFTDMTRQAGLRDPSFGPLGFGTQFLDADLDGLPDLVLTNGHIDDLRAIGQPYEMSPQFFHNLGGGKFVELAGAPLGEFFAGKYLGRGLARLDWDRDGREDFAVSHIASPAALVVNRSQNAGHFLALHLRGQRVDRDAIGTTVRVTSAGRTTMQQLTAGDGYQASNERRLVFGLGGANVVERIHVRWLSGAEQTFAGVAADAEYILIEGRDELVPVRRP